MNLSFDYSWSHTWRNYGILVAFGVFFLTTYLALTEINSDTAEVHPVVEFKRGTKNVPKGIAPPPDVENNNDGGDTVTTTDVGEETGERLEEVEKSLEKSLKTTDIMSWAHLTYHVSVGGGERRRLLNDISGWVVPGKLTALVGESGAGKVSPSVPRSSFPISSPGVFKTTLLNVLAHRADVGVITGNQFVNGQALPADFQAQTGYCQQMDTHEPTSTVREAVLFSAVLRQPQSVPMEEKQA